MAKIKLGNVKGPKGDQGVRGSKWFNTANITGTPTSGTAFPNSGIASAMVGDMALNPTTLNLYICQTAGNAATAKWAFIACIKGPQGAKGDKGDPTTVDAVLSESSANPIQNKAVATKFKDVQDSLAKTKSGAVSVTVAKRSNVTVKIAKQVGEDVIIANAMSSYQGVRAQGKIDNGYLVACVFNDTDIEWKGSVCWIAR